MSAAVRQEVVRFKRKLLRERLSQLTLPQQTFFAKIWSHPYPGLDPIEAMTEEQLMASIDLCDRTLAENQSSPPARDGDV